MDILSEEHLRGELYKLEQSLANFESRDIAQRVLCDDFAEFGSSGRVYGKKNVLDMYMTTSGINHAITDYSIAFLSDSVVKAAFKSDFCGKKALRTSIWLFVDGSWKMIFHQGTACKEEWIIACKKRKTRARGMFFASNGLLRYVVLTNLCAEVIMYRRVYL